MKIEANTRRAKLIEMLQDQDQKITQLQKDNDQLRQSLTDEANNYAALAQENQRLADELTEEIPDAVKLIQLKQNNDLLMQTVEMSCKDHCPYHQRKDACQTCSIWRNLKKVRKHLQEA